MHICQIIYADVLGITGIATAFLYLLASHQFLHHMRQRDVLAEPGIKAYVRSSMEAGRPFRWLERRFFFSPKDESIVQQTGVAGYVPLPPNVPQCKQGIHVFTVILTDTPTR